MDLTAREPEGLNPVVRALGWLRGRDLEPETHLLTRRVFLVLMAVVYLAAFVSLWVQVQGLVGSRGIAPAAKFLEEVGEIAGGARLWRVPSLLWLWSGDAALHALCAGGVLLSLLLELLMNSGLVSIPNSVRSMTSPVVRLRSCIRCRVLVF